MRAVHVLELRQLVDTVRAVCDLPRAAWTDGIITSGETPIRAVHLTELRTALSEAYGACSLTPPAYTDPGDRARKDADQGSALDGTARRGSPGPGGDGALSLWLDSQEWDVRTGEGGAGVRRRPCVTNLPFGAACRACSGCSVIAGRGYCICLILDSTDESRRVVAVRVDMVPALRFGATLIRSCLGVSASSRSRIGTGPGELWEADPWGRAAFGLPPPSYGDYAWVQPPYGG